MRRIPIILLVDDGETASFLHQRLLFRLNVSDQVLVASNGAQALEILTRPNARFSPARSVLALLDLHMPVLNGFESFEAFRALPPIQQRCAVVVLLTSSLSTQDIDHCNTLPIAGSVNKPLDKVRIDTLLHLHFAPLVTAE